MPLPAAIAVTIAVLGSAAYLTNTVRTMLRRRRNMKHWEKGEPLEGGIGEWD
jgi:hypothetical protein